MQPEEFFTSLSEVKMSSNHYKLSFKNQALNKSTVLPVVFVTITVNKSRLVHSNKNHIGC